MYLAMDMISIVISRMICILNFGLQVSSWLVPEFSPNIPVTFSSAMLLFKETFSPLQDVRVAHYSHDWQVRNKLCELNSLRLGYAASCTFQKKDTGRLSARCSSSGFVKKLPSTWNPPKGN